MKKATFFVVLVAILSSAFFVFNNARAEFALPTWLPLVEKIMTQAKVTKAQSVKIAKAKTKQVAGVKVADMPDTSRAYVADEVIVTFDKAKLDVKKAVKASKTKVSIQGAGPQRLLADYGINNSVYNFNYDSNDVLLKTEPGETAVGLWKKLKAKNDSKIKSIDLNYVLIPNSQDPRYKEQWSQENTGQYGDANDLTNRDIDIDDSDNVDFQAQSAAPVIVAVIDSMIDIDHPDLKEGNWWNNSGCVNWNGEPIVAGCVKGYNVADNNNVLGYDRKDMTIVKAGELLTHGTNVTGLIMAKANNGIGIRGIAPNAQIMFLQIAGYRNYNDEDGRRKRGWTSSVYYLNNAISFARKNGARIINASFGDQRPNDNTKAAIEDFVKDGLYVTGAGNDSSNLNNKEYYPTSYGFGALISVAGLCLDGKICDYSNYGSSLVDLAAPGEKLLTTDPLEDYELRKYTSFTAPIVTAVAAVVWGLNPNWTNLQVKQRLMDTVTPYYDNAHPTRSNGYVNLANAINDCRPERYDWCNDYGKQKCGNFQAKKTDICGKNFVVDVECDDCRSGSICNEQTHICQVCTPKKEQELCDQRGWKCGEDKIIDDCTGKSRKIDCGDCPKNFSCSEQKTCQADKTVPGIGGPRDINGNKLINGGYYPVVNGTPPLNPGSYVFAANGNFGQLVSSATTQTTGYKYCYGDTQANCDKYGGLYKWSVAMGLSPTCDTTDCSPQINKPYHQGLCPTGYHIGTDAEWAILENYGMTPGSVIDCDPARLNKYACPGAGDYLQKQGPNDFQAQIFLGTSNNVYNSTVNYVSASQNGASNVIVRELAAPITDSTVLGKAPLPSTLANYTSGISRKSVPKSKPMALRCFADCTKVDGTWGDWLPIGGCGEFIAGKLKQLRHCKAACGGALCSGASYQVVDCDPATYCGDLVKYEGGPLDVFGNPADKGGYYPTVKLANGQCWLAANLNVGTLIPKTSYTTTPTKKYCYLDDEANCAKYGGLYTLMQATKSAVDYASMKMSYSAPAVPYLAGKNTQGICPTGYVMPNNADWKKAKESSAADIDSLKLINLPIMIHDKLEWGWSGIGSQVTRSSEGVIKHNNQYDMEGDNRAMLYGSTVTGGNSLTPAYQEEPYGLPVRCLKTCLTVTGGWSEWIADGTCQQYQPDMQKYIRTCTNPAPACGGAACAGEAVKYVRCTPVANCGMLQYPGGPWDSTGTRHIPGDPQAGYYRTIKIGSQCWMRDNMNIGIVKPAEKMVNNEIVINPQNDPNQFEKFCNPFRDGSFIEPKPELCNDFGGLYQWAEAMNLPYDCNTLSYLNSSDCATAPRHRGICPMGWHIPTQADFHALELSVYDQTPNSSCPEYRYSGEANQPYPSSASDYNNCTSGGPKLKFGGSTGFDAYYKDAWSSYLKVNYVTIGGTTYNEYFKQAIYRADTKLWGMWLANSDLDQPYNAANWPREIDPPGSKAAYSRFLTADQDTTTGKGLGIYSIYSPKLAAMYVRCVKDSCIGDLGNQGLDNSRNKLNTIQAVSPAHADIGTIVYLQTVRNTLDNYKYTKGTYPVSFEQVSGGQSLLPSFSYRPEYGSANQSVTHVSYDDYSLSYALAGGLYCNLPAGTYVASRDRSGLPNQATKSTAVITPSDAELNRQILAIIEAIDKVSVGKALTQEQLKYLTNSRQYFIDNNYDYNLILQKVTR